MICLHSQRKSVLKDFVSILFCPILFYSIQLVPLLSFSQHPRTSQELPDNTFCMFHLLFNFERCNFTKDSGIKLVLDWDSNYRRFFFFALDCTWCLSHGIVKGKGKSNFCFN